MDKALSYWRNALDEESTLTPFEVQGKLSMSVASSYSFWRLCLLDKSLILLKPRNEFFRVSVAEKQLPVVSEKLGEPVVLWVDQLSDYQRKKLLDSRLPFISGDKQMYLPFMGVYFSNRSGKTARKNPQSTTFTGTEQMVFLYCLYSSDPNTSHRTSPGMEFSQEDAKEKLAISQMSVSRAFQRFVELEMLEFKVAGKTGRKKTYQFAGDPNRCKKRFFEIGKKHFGTPITKTIFMRDHFAEIGVKAGVEVLAEESMLSTPSHSIRAISKEEYETIKTNEWWDFEAANEPGGTEIQVLKYDPTLISKIYGAKEKGVYDRLDPATLFFSLADNPDERVQSALERFMGRFNWFQE